MSHLRTAIIGAGPAGLALARLLQVNKLSCTVFELDASSLTRDQGGTIDLHGNAGQRVLREAGLSEELKKHARPEGEAMKLIKYDGRIVLDVKDGGSRPAEFSDRPEIDRLALRQMLLDSIKPGTVKWNKKLQSVRPSLDETDKYDLHFADGVEEGYDLVIGAEGAWSKVRKLLTDEEPFYSGITMVELWALNVDKTKPWLSEYVGKGGMYMFDEGRVIAAQRSSEHIRTYAGVRKPENWLTECGIDWSHPETAKKELIDQYYANCGEDLKRCIIESNDKLVTRQLYHMAVGLRWAPRPGITVIGDAAHLMTPFGGVGVNLALLDALFLSKAIVQADGDKVKLFDNMRAFETDMFDRAETFGRRTLMGLENHFSANGIEERAAMMQAKMEATKVNG